MTHQRVGPKEKIKRGQIKLTEAYIAPPPQFIPLCHIDRGKSTLLQFDPGPDYLPRGLSVPPPQGTLEKLLRHVR